MEMHDLLGEDVARVLDKLPIAEATRLVRANKHMLDLSTFWKTQYRFHDKSLTIYAAEEGVTLKTNGNAFPANAEETAQFHFKEITVGLAWNQFDVKSLTHCIPKNIICSRLSIRVYHPFMQPFKATDILTIFNHFKAQDIHFQCIQLDGIFEAKLRLVCLSYVVFHAEEVVFHLEKVPTAEYICLDVGGRPQMSEILTSLTRFWQRGNHNISGKWIKLRLYRDAETDFNEVAIRQEFSAFLDQFPHTVVAESTSVEKTLTATYRIKTAEGLFLFSEPANNDSLFGLKYARVDFLPNYDQNNKYEDSIFHCAH